MKVESYNTQRALQKIKRHNPPPAVSDVAKHRMDRLTLGSAESSVGPQSNEHDKSKKTSKLFTGGPASWYVFHIKI